MESTIQSNITHSPPPCPRCGGVMCPATGPHIRGLVCPRCDYRRVPSEAERRAWYGLQIAEPPRPGAGTRKTVDTRLIIGGALLIIGGALVLAPVLEGLVSAGSYAILPESGTVGSAAAMLVLVLVHLVAPAAVGYLFGRTSAFSAWRLQRSS